MTKECLKHLEELAAIEHDQWIVWTKGLAKHEKISPVRLKRWKKLWVPYTNLPEAQKQVDRKLARKVCKIL